MKDIERLQLQKSGVTENIGRVTRQIITMEEVLEETEEKLLAMEFEMVKKDSRCWQEMAEKAKKFRQRLSHLKSELRRFKRMEAAYDGQIEKLKEIQSETAGSEKEIQQMLSRKEKLSRELEEIAKQRTEAERRLQELDEKRKTREEKIKKTAKEKENEIQKEPAEKPQEKVSDSEKIKDITDLASAYDEIEENEKEIKKVEKDIEFAAPRSLDQLKFKVEKFKSSDLPEIIEIESISFPRPWRRYMFYNEVEIPVSHHYVLKAIGQGDEFVMAYCIFWVSDKKMDIKNFAVHPSYRREGIGFKFLKAMLNRAKALGAGKATYIIRSSFTAGRALLKKGGFEESEVKEDYFGFKKENGILMEKELDNER